MKLLWAVVLLSLTVSGDCFVPPAQQFAAKSTSRATFPENVVGAANQALSDLSIKADSTALLSELEKTVSELSFKIDSTASLSELEKTISSIPWNLEPHLSLDTALRFATPWHLSIVTALLAGNAFLSFLMSPDDNAKAPYAPGTTTYDPEVAAEFYSNRPLLVLKRVLRLGLLTSALGTGILFDWLVLGKLFKDEEYTALKQAEPQRAKEALLLCQQLGPTFIKLGQALSIRTDLIPEAYALELRQLQDNVPPFDNEEAYDVIRNQLGVQDLSEIFSELSTETVASASIGQCYRGKLVSTGKEVAVKVQRPGILAEIALDLHVLRILTPIQTILQNAANGVKTTQEDIDTAILLVDEWGRGFVAECDYRLEAQNTINFEAAMRQRELDAVCAPTVVPELVRDTVLVTEWVNGTRLDLDASSDVPRLCGVAINAYLTMLLDTGTLHCDPHPGNLLRTEDGRLCILDWGMTLEVPNDLQYALLELIAHINVEDYDAIPQDFINLGFTPEGVTAERLQQSGITEGLTFAFRQLSAGGGPKGIQERVKAEFQERYGADLSDKELQEAARADLLLRMEEQLESEGVDVKGVTNVMEEMSKRNRELFALPPYVLYVARAFSTLEGIGLSIDPNYAIVQECFPYLAKRLFTDRSPRAKKALRAMLGLNDMEEEVDGSRSALSIVQAGATGKESKSGALSPSKLIELSEGFNSYTAATTEVDNSLGQATAAREFANLLLDPKGSALQDILVEETARFGDAATRAALREALVESSFAKAAAETLRSHKDFVEQSPLARLLPGPLKTVFIDQPAEFPQLLADLVATTEEDERILASASELRDAIGSRFTASGDNTIRNAAAVQLSDGASLLPSQPDLSALQSALSDAETRQAAANSLPGVAALGRRVGAGLLRRAAFRTDRTSVLPESTRKSLIEASNALADGIDYDNEEASNET